MPVTNIVDRKMLRSAKLYAERWGLHIFPLHEVHDGVCSCSDGASCGNPGKHPRTHRGLLEATVDLDKIEAWWKRWPQAPIGIACGPSGLVVVDVDPRNGGDDSLVELEREHGALPQTWTALTGGGGQHYVYAAPAGKEIRSTKLAIGIDIKAGGGYIIAAPSLHVSGRAYAWDVNAHPDDIEHPAPLPGWVLAKLEQPARKQYARSSAAVTDGLIGAAFEAAGWMGRGLGDDRSAVQCPWEDEHTGGKRYDSSTVVFAPAPGRRTGWFHCSHSHCADRKLADVLAVLPADAIAQARAKLGLPESYDPAADRGPERMPAQPEPGAPDERDDWMRSVRYTPKGLIAPDAGNAALILCNHPEWYGTVSYDEFADVVSWVRPPPALHGLQAPEPGAILQDAHWVYVAHWLSRYCGAAYSKQATLDAIDVAARANTRHPLRDWLSALEWDGVRRVDGWLSTYLGGRRSSYDDLVGRLWLVSAVARIMQPGCQADATLILEGEQGSGKSKASRILGGAWHLGTMPSLREREEASARIQGHWIIEIGELDAFRGSEATAIKDFLTQVQDVYRRKYTRLEVRRPRQCVFIGTTNEREYLRDATGARRFWPVRVGSTDEQALRRDRDQLWAEAVALFHDGMDWWPDAEQRELFTEEQEDRYVEDPWEGRIAQWTARQTEPFTVADVLTLALGIETQRLDRPHQTRVGAALKRLGYRSRRIARGAGRVRVYDATSNLDALANLDGQPLTENL